jgi:hypothetical protein
MLNISRKKSIRLGGSTPFKETSPTGEFLDFIRRGGLIFLLLFCIKAKK